MSNEQILDKMCFLDENGKIVKELYKKLELSM